MVHLMPCHLSPLRPENGPSDAVSAVSSQASEEGANDIHIEQSQTRCDCDEGGGHIAPAATKKKKKHHHQHPHQQWH